MSRPTTDKSRLLVHAQTIARVLQTHRTGTTLRISIPQRLSTTKTGGWRAVIGDLGEGQPQLEIWLDHFTGNETRNFYACFFSEQRNELTQVANRVARKLRPHRVITSSDLENDVHCSLRTGLSQKQYSVPILENYARRRRFFYGIYDPSPITNGPLNRAFCANAAAFFESVARTQSGASPEPEDHGVYPQAENRTSVRSHLQRERSQFLASERKRLDHYICQVCAFDFAETYGHLGMDFAESHHRVPLNQLRGSVRTRVEDLITVCANCHRMLHRMPGRRHDAARLATLYRLHRKQKDARPIKPLVSA